MKKVTGYFKICRNFIYLCLIRLLYRRQKFDKKYYVSICAIFKNEGKYLKEWIDYHLVAGVEHFYLYNNFSDDNYKKILDPYVKAGIVTLTEWPVEHGQRSAYNDCVVKYSDESNWIGFIDLDEYVCPVKWNSIKDWLKNYERYPLASAFWRMFSSSGVMKEDRSKTLIEQFTVCSDVISTSKMFLNTHWSKRIKEFRISHICRFKFWGKLAPDNAYLFFMQGARKKEVDVQINHYFSKSAEYWAKKKMVVGDAYYQTSENKRPWESFFWCEDICNKTDYKIFKFLVKLKMKAEE